MLPWAMTDTLELEGSDTDIERAAELLRQGSTVVFPTETVYGLGANAYSSEAVQKIYAAKGRPSDNPLIVHVADLADLKLAAGVLKPEEELLFSTFAPGPLTLIVQRSNSLCPEVSAGLPTVGLRVPSHPLARRLLKHAAVPVAAPSANRSGRPSPTDFAMAWAEMDGHAAAVLNGGASSVGLESTIVWLHQGQVHVLRPGAVSGRAVLRVLTEGGFAYTLAEAATNEAPSAPGTRYRHYSPRARVHLWGRGQVPPKPSPGEHWVYIGPGHSLDEAKGLQTSGSLFWNCGTIDEYARSLYRHLVAADHHSATDVALWLEPSLEPDDVRAGLVEALRDRCRRAAGLYSA